MIDHEERLISVDHLPCYGDARDKGASRCGSFSPIKRGI
jgi:hypothetical protein